MFTILRQLMFNWDCRYGGCFDNGRALPEMQRERVLDLYHDGFGHHQIVVGGGGGKDRGAGSREKKGRETGSLRWREAGEKFKKASFCYLLMLTSSQRNEPKNVSWLPFNVFRGLQQNFIHEKSQKTKIRARDKKNGITSCEIGNLSKSLYTS